MATAALLISHPAAAKSDSQLWTGSSVSAKLGGRWSLSAEGVARFGDKEHGLYQTVLAAGLGYRLAKGVTFQAAYVHAPSYAGGHLTSLEHRFREQLSFEHIAQLGPVALSGRLRLEERWRDSLTGTGWRIRPMLRATLPVRGSLALFANHESFINLSETGWQPRGYDRMRNAIGMAFPLVPGVKAEASYLEQHIRVRGAADEGDHVAALSLAWSL